MFIDGWILETLDPYTTEKYAIPSTRCTRVIAADYAGSLPAAVNAVTNTTLVRTLLSVETYMKGIASLPFARLPAAGVLIHDKRAEEEHPEPVPSAAAAAAGPSSERVDPQTARREPRAHADALDTRRPRLPRGHTSHCPCRTTGGACFSSFLHLPDISEPEL